MVIKFNEINTKINNNNIYKNFYNHQKSTEIII